MFSLFRVNRFISGRLIAVASLAILAVVSSEAVWSVQPQGEAKGPIEPNATASGFLNLVNKGNEKALRAAPGLMPDVVEKILAFRKEGKTFRNIREFRTVTAIRSVDMQAAIQPYIDLQQNVPRRRPVPDPEEKQRMMMQKSAASAAADPASGTGATPPARDSVVSEGLISDVRPGFFAHLPGYQDWEGVDPVTRKEFLETVNREKCTCGCVNETLAFCLVNDPGCPVVKARVKKIYDDIIQRSKAAAEE